MMGNVTIRRHVFQMVWKQNQHTVPKLNNLTHQRVYTAW